MHNDSLISKGITWKLSLQWSLNRRVFFFSVVLYLRACSCVCCTQTHTRVVCMYFSGSTENESRMNFRFRVFFSQICAKLGFFSGLVVRFSFDAVIFRCWAAYFFFFAHFGQSEWSTKCQLKRCVKIRFVEMIDIFVCKRINVCSVFHRLKRERVYNYMLWLSHGPD